MLFALVVVATAAATAATVRGLDLDGILPDQIGARSDLCDNSFLRDGKINQYVCNDQIQPVIDKIGLGDKLQVGPCSTLCRAYGCALLALGCGDEFNELEKQVGDECDDLLHCDTFVGLGDGTCEAIGDFLVPEPGAPLLPTSGDTILPFIKAQVALCNNPAQLQALINALDGSNNELFGADVQALVAEYQTPCGTFCESGVCLLHLFGCDPQYEAARSHRDRNIAGVATCAGEGPLVCQGHDRCADRYRPTEEKCNPLQQCPPFATPWFRPDYAPRSGTLSDVEFCCPTVCGDVCAAPGTTCKPGAKGTGGPNGEAPLSSPENPTPAQVAALRTTCTNMGPTWDLGCSPITHCYYCHEPCKGVQCPALNSCPAGQVIAKEDNGCCNRCTTCGTLQATGKCPPTPASCPAGQVVAPPCVGAACTVADDCCTRCVPETRPVAPPADNTMTDVTATVPEASDELPMWVWIVIGVGVLCCCILLLLVLAVCMFFMMAAGGRRNDNPSTVYVQGGGEMQRRHSGTHRSRSNTRGTSRSRSNTAGGRRSRTGSRATKMSAQSDYMTVDGVGAGGYPAPTAGTYGSVNQAGSYGMTPGAGATYSDVGTAEFQR